MAPSAQQPKHFYDFGPFRLDATERLLFRDGQLVPLTLKAFQTLLVLVENNGHIVEKDEIMNRVWPDTFVEEITLVQNVSTLRKALGESSAEHHYIETIPKRGYRFVASVKEFRVEDIDASANEIFRPRTIIEGVEDGSGTGKPAISEPVAPKMRTAGRWRLGFGATVFAVCVTLAGMAGAIVLIRVVSGPKPPQTVAVRPFKPLMADGREEALELGMAETLITKLSHIRQIMVLPVSAVRRYTGIEQDPLAAGRALRVDLVLDGSIQRWSDRVRVTVRLVKVADGTTIWADQFDQNSTDLFAVQDSISARVAEALVLRLTGEERKLLVKRYTQSNEAYQAYMKGRHFWNMRTGDGLKKAIDYFRQAIAIDPAYALAYSGLGDCYVILGSAGYDARPPAEDMPRAKEAALKALELDHTLAEAHATLGFIKAWYEWDWPGAEEEFKRAIQLNPGYATAHQWYGWYLITLGRFDEAVIEMKRAQNLDPLSLIVGANVGAPFYYARRYDRAAEHFRQVVDLDPNFGVAHAWLGWVALEKGEFPKAIAEFQRNQRLSEEGHYELGYAYARSGKGEEAQIILRRLQEQARQRYVSAHAVALIYAALGEKDQAFAWLEKASQDRDEELALIKVDPKVDSLRSDQRFGRLLQRIGLAQ